jgi:diguanylate cyclase (GGDEF)-like protein
VKDYGIYLLISILVGFAAYIISNYYMSRIHSAKTDPLTETLIRSEFRKYVHNTLKHQKTCALLVLDMDHFKSINDTYGHLAGDEVLIHAALEMQRSIRHGDLVSRVGGDEYMILLHNIETEEQVLAAISRIRKAAEQEVIFGKNHIQPELSIGYALSPEEGDVFETLYQLADKRMYQDKLKRRTSK